MLDRRQEESCKERGNAFPFCSPGPEDTWNNGTIHSFVWNPGYPFYSSSETIDLYLYYKENLQLHLIKNWTALPCRAGSWAVQVDNSWFPSSPLYNQTQKRWIMYGYYLPSLMNPVVELSNPESQYPRPFNFSIMQYGIPHYGNDSRSTPPLKTDSLDDPVHELPIWAIIVLTITSATLVLLIGLLWLIYKRRPSQNEDMKKNEDGRKEDKEDVPPLDASWQRRSSILSSANAANLGQTIQKMIESPDWDDSEERRRRQGDLLLRRELEADKETMVKNNSPIV